MQAAQRPTSDHVRAELPAPHHSTPTNNYFSGDGKSYVWADAAYYAPSDHSWTRYPDYHSLPSISRRDNIDFQSEDNWVKYVRNRDQPSGYYPNHGILMSKDPGVTLNGYSRCDPAPPNLLLSPLPLRKLDAWVAPIRKGEGEYHAFYNGRLAKKRENELKSFCASRNLKPPDRVQQYEYFRYGKVPTSQQEQANDEKFYNYESHQGQQNLPQSLQRCEYYRHSEVPMIVRTEPNDEQINTYRSRWGFNAP